jgi:hypothetical protein
VAAGVRRLRRVAPGSRAYVGFPTAPAGGPGQLAAAPPGRGADAPAPVMVHAGSDIRSAGPMRILGADRRHGS